MEDWVVVFDSCRRASDGGGFSSFNSRVVGRYA
jgi:hypothetical protein